MKDVVLWWCILEITHEKLQGYVVDENVIQWDNTQLAKVGCQLQSIHLLHNRERISKVWYTD